MNITMVDLTGQYNKIRKEIDEAVLNEIRLGQYINGRAVKEFQAELEQYLAVRHVVPCANGTDALQIALMALDLQVGDEIIVPAFTFVSTAEVIGLLKLKPVLVDVDIDTFNISTKNLEKALSKKTKAILPVHLFGLSCAMEPVMDFAQAHHLYVVEDNAQAIGCDYFFSDGSAKKTGTIGDVGCTSFFPSKNLGCYGDGGALMSNDDRLAERCRMIANHGQKEKYHHEILGCNSRLDAVQAAVLSVKLKYLDAYIQARQSAAQYYTAGLSDIDAIDLPRTTIRSTHVYNQYTIRIKNGKRDALQQFLAKNGVPTMIYYPRPIHEQNAFKSIVSIAEPLNVSNYLSENVLSLPMHTELSGTVQDFIIRKMHDFFS